jgi:trk system potassium uptake protein TrkH
MKARTAGGYKLIFGYLGIFIALIGVITLIPLLMIAFYWDEWRCWADFAIPGLASIVLGLGLFFGFLYKAEKQQLAKHQDSVLLVLIWLFAVAMGAFPFFLMGKVDGAAHTYSYSEAFFESTSGYATTGFTVFLDVLDAKAAYGIDAFCPHVFLFYRSFTQFIGGVGLVLIVASVISDRYGMKLYYAEGHNDKLLPNLAKSAKFILSIYTAYIVLGTLALWLFGMDWFEALNHSIAALATGGFSTRSTSITYFIDSAYTGNGLLPYNQVGMEITMCVLMLLGATSFVLHLSIITFKWKKFFKDCEVRFIAVFLIVVILLMSLGISIQYENMNSAGEIGSYGTSFWNALHYATFQAISCLTTTGFSNVAAIVHLGSGALFLSVICMIIGGGMGSTAGAIKQYRVIVIAKEIYWDFKYRLTPSRMMYPHLITRAGETKEVDVSEYRDCSLYALFYLSVLAVGSLALSYLPGYNFQEGIYEFASGLSGTGNTIIDFIAYKASYALYQYDISLWILSFAMFIGRLEIVPVYFAIYRATRDIFHKETV